MKLLFSAILIINALTGFGASMTESNLSQSELGKRIKRLTPVTISTDIGRLSEGDKKALLKVVEAAKWMDPIYLRQVWTGNVSLKAKLEQDQSPTGKALYHYFNQNKGAWARLDKNEVFVSGIEKEKPIRAGFYPEDLTKTEFEEWTKSLSAKDKALATGFFTVIRRDPDKKLKMIPYSIEYKEFLQPAATLLKEAAELTTNESLKKFLKLRAEAFSSDDYYASDVAWMDLEAPIEVTIGPYETYEDELYGYKAAFEAFITLRDDVETAKLAKFSSYLQEIENHLPMEEKYKNPKLGALAPIRVVDEVFASGEARRGVTTAAFNLPNDEKVVKEKGSKRVMLKNIQEAKFKKVLTPISGRVLSKNDQKHISFEAFFTHILMHELMHGLGPHSLSIAGKESNVRMELKEFYSALEEAKADISGLFALQYLMDKGVIEAKKQREMYTTFLASSFRSVRFGITEAHGKGIALQFNYLSDEGAFIYDGRGKFTINLEKMVPAVTKLTREILTIQAEGNYEKAKALLAKYAVIRPPMEKALKGLSDVPVDIEPSFPLAEDGKLSE